MAGPDRLLSATFAAEVRREGSVRGGPRGARPRACALLELSSGRGGARRERAASSPALTSKTRAIRKATAPRRARSQRWSRPASAGSWKRWWSPLRERLCPPCGGCRQRLAEFAGPEAPIHLCDPQGLRRTLTLGELLPFSFALGDAEAMGVQAKPEDGPAGAEPAHGRASDGQKNDTRSAVDVIRARLPHGAPRVWLGSRLRAERDRGRDRERHGDRLRRPALAFCALAWRATPDGWCSVASAASRSPVCKAGSICTRACPPPRSTSCRAP